MSNLTYYSLHSKRCWQILPPRTLFFRFPTKKGLGREIELALSLGFAYGFDDPLGHRSLSSVSIPCLALLLCRRKCHIWSSLDLHVRAFIMYLPDLVEWEWDLSVRERWMWWRVKIGSLAIRRGCDNEDLRFNWAARSRVGETRSEMSTIARLRVGRYEIGRTLGEGTFAKVKFARNVETRENVAIKILDKEKVLLHRMVGQVLFFSFSAFWFEEK